MTTPATIGPASTSAANAETELIAAIATLCGATSGDWRDPNTPAVAGSGVVTVGTYPSGASTATVVLTSTGESRAHHIVGAVTGDDSTRVMQAFTGADTNAIAPGSLPDPEASGGLIYPVNNDDSSGLSPKLCYTGTGAPPASTSWVQRDAISAYEYFGVANKDFMIMWVEYESGGIKAQGLIHIGIPLSISTQRMAYRSCRGIIYSNVDAGGGIRVITLDRLIHLPGSGFPFDAENPNLFPNDTYPVYLQFQARMCGEAGESADFGLVSRIQVIKVPGTLTTAVVGGVTVTVFNINAQAGAPGAPNYYKLDSTGGRYDSGRGASSVNGLGDIVSLVTEPNLAICQSDTAGGTYSALSCGAIMAWAAGGFQASGGDTAKRATLMAAGTVPDTEWTDNQPSALTGLPIPVAVRVGGNSNMFNTRGLRENVRNVGVLQGLLLSPHMPSPDKSIYRLDGDDAKKYRKANNTAGIGMNRLQDTVATITAGAFDHLIGPGWSSP